MANDFRDTASFGKRQEFIAIAELLRRGFDVYLPLVDDQGIDCVIRRESRGTPIYIDVQIKARSVNAQQRSWMSWPSFNVRSPRWNYVFVFYSEPAETYWIIPTLELIKLASPSPRVGHEDDLRIAFGTCREIGMPKHRPEFEPYVNNFDLMRSLRQ